MEGEKNIEAHRPLMKTPLVLAVDAGGTNTVFGLVDHMGSVLIKTNVATLDFDRPDALVQYVYRKFLEEFSESVPAFTLEGIGIGAPNGNFFRGTIEHAPNLPWKGIVPLASMFTETFGVRSLITNDANAAALGEMQFGAAKGMKDFIFITLGTGLGSGIIVDGKLVYGHDGFAGELGHTIIIQHGRPCGCGRRGCLEQYCSANGLVKTYREIMMGSGLPAGNLGEMQAKTVFDLAMGGDEAAFYAFNYTGELLGYALANAVAFTSPEAIFLFGGLADAGELLFNPTILSFEKNLLGVYRNTVSILPSALPENDAALLGAASIIWTAKN